MTLKTKSKQSSKNNISLNSSVIKVLIKGTAIGLLIFLCGLFLLSLILSKTGSDTKNLYYAIYIFISLGSFASAIFTQKRISGRGFVIGILSSLPYMVFLLILNAIILKFNSSINMLMIVPFSIAGGFSGGITAVNLK